MTINPQARARLFAHLGWDAEEDFETAIREWNDRVTEEKELTEND